MNKRIFNVREAALHAEANGAGTFNACYHKLDMFQAFKDPEILPGPMRRTAKEYLENKVKGMQLLIEKL